MYIITGKLNGYYENDFDQTIEVKKVYKAKTKLTAFIKIIYAKMFYDWVDINKI